MAKKWEFQFLKDEPVKKTDPGFFSFYHEKFAPALKEILESESCLHTIGLFGKWGTGKSTIIDLLKIELDNQKYEVFIFDVWKYQEDSLRRIFLIEFVKFLNEKGFEINERILDPLYKSNTIEVKEETNSESARNDLKNKKIGIIIAIIGFIIFDICFKKVFGIDITQLTSILGGLTVLSVT